MRSASHDRRLGNLLGALGVALFDAIASDAELQVGRGGQTAAALVLIGHVPDLSIDSLARGLALSHAGTVRLVDRLATDGFVERLVRDDDRRAVRLRLTTEGRHERRIILRKRASRLAHLVARLDDRDRNALERIVERLLTPQITSVSDALRVCRFCDEANCPDCPVDAALSA